MLMSQVNSEESERIKKRLYISEVDEYNASSEPLNSKSLAILYFTSTLASIRRVCMRGNEREARRWGREGIA